MIMERFAVGAGRAFDMRVALSQEPDTPVAEIARRVVEYGSEPYSTVDAPLLVDAPFLR